MPGPKRRHRALESRSGLRNSGVGVEIPQGLSQGIEIFSATDKTPKGELAGIKKLTSRGWRLLNKPVSCDIVEFVFEQSQWEESVIPQRNLLSNTWLPNVRRNNNEI